MPGLTYDAGALLAGEANSRTLWALHRRLLERGLRASWDKRGGVDPRPSCPGC
mgnify:CR=1 FL=1